MKFNKKNLFLVFAFLSLNNLCLASDNNDKEDAHSFGYMAAAKQKAGKAIAGIQAVLNYEPFATSRTNINDEFTNSITKAFGQDTALAIPTTPETVRRHASGIKDLFSFKTTEEHQMRIELKKLFAELKEIDESIKNIPTSNGYFYKLLKDTHECNNCDGNCPTNKPLTNHDIILDADNVAQFSYLKDKRSEKLNTIRTIYKEATEINYTSENSDAVNNVSDSEDESNESTPRIKTKKSLKKAIRHTHKIYDTSYNKLDVPNKSAVPALKAHLEAAQHNDIQETSNYGWVKTTVTTALGVAIPVVAKILSEQ